ncbi:MAG: glycosyltransferase [Bacteroidales bacterium]|nr:glycosyltransferase [Bacteroidales bacterium]
MNVFLILKCGYLDSYYFIDQIQSLSEIKKIYVFRDDKTIESEKSEFILPITNKFKALKVISRLLQVLSRKKLNPKIIIGIYEIPHGLLAVIAGLLLKKPSVVSIIGNPAYAKLRKGLRLKLILWILKKCTFATVTGSNSKNFLISKNIEPDKIFILPNTLDFSFFEVLNIRKEYDIVSLGRISEEKHVEIIVAIIKKIKLSNSSVRAAIAGKGDQLETIKQLIKENDLTENIELLGYVPDEEMNLFFNKGRIFILTSETEGFPRTIVQAAACGVPVIASNVGDISDVIDNNVNGFLINDYKDIDAYCEKIHLLLNDHELYHKFSNELNIKVRKLFSKENASKVWLEIINKIDKK